MFSFTSSDTAAELEAAEAPESVKSRPNTFRMRTTYAAILDKSSATEADEPRQMGARVSVPFLDALAAM